MHAPRRPSRPTLPWASHNVSRRMLGALIVAGATACTAACGGSGHAATSTPTASQASTTGSGSPVASPTPSGPYTPPALPLPATSGSLHQQADIVFPPSAHDGVGYDAAEAPDGSVFVATAATTGGPDTIVYVVDGDAPPATAEHVPAGVLGLAADDTDLYVATATTITEYDRTGGAPVRSWPVGFGTAGALGASAMKLAGGVLWAEVANPTRIVELTPTSSTITSIAAGTNIDSFAVDASGIYYVESGGQTLVHVTTAGVRTTAPTNQTVNLQLSGPAAVSAVTVVGSVLVVDHADGQGLDASLVTFDTTSLRYLASAATNQNTTSVVSTLAGPLVLAVPEGSGCGGVSTAVEPATASVDCITRVTLATAATSVAFGLSSIQSADNGDLLGPYPAVLVDESGVLHLLRVG